MGCRNNTSGATIQLTWTIPNVHIEVDSAPSPRYISQKVFEITNNLSYDIDIYLRIVTHESFYLNLLRNTTAHLATKYGGFSWVAYTEQEPDAVDQPTLSQGTPVENTGTLMYPSWFALVLHDIIPGTFCNCCSNKFGDTIDSKNSFCVVPQYFINSGGKGLIDFNMITCLYCYYRAVFDSHLKHNKAPAIIKRNAWWERGRWIEIGSRKSSEMKSSKKSTGSQNDLVKLIVKKYLAELESQNDKKESEFATLPLLNEEEEEDQNENKV